MPVRLDIKKKLNARSERVKCVDIHPTEPWVLSSLYDGNVHIYNYQTQSVVKSFEASDQPVRCGKFIVRKQWIVVGSDDMMIRVYNYNTMEKVKMFEAHMDYIRSIAVHPSLPLIVSASDDMLIKLWDWEKNWANTVIFEGHSHYVMQVAFNPKDPNTFASASLDHTIKVWNLTSPVPNFTLEGHEKGVNCIDYYAGGDKPYLVSGGDDQLLKVWDYQTKACVQSLDAHTHNVSAVAFLPDRPLIISGSEDGMIKLWNSNTYRLETTLGYHLDRVWSISAVRGTNKVAFGFDNGTVVVRLGKDYPVASMDASGKAIVAKHNEIVAVNIRSGDTASFVDGEKLPVASKDLGSCEIYPQKVTHSPNGRFVAVSGDGEYIIYTALAWRNKSFGSADEIVWDSGAGEFATRKGNSDVRVFNKSFKERNIMQIPFSAEGIYGGATLAIRSDDFVCFYDWESLQLIRKIEVETRNVFWSPNSELVAITGEQSFYVLRYNRDVVDQELEANGGKINPDGIETAFSLVCEVAEKVMSGCWVGDCFIYTNSNSRLNYCVGNETATLFHLDQPLFVLGYLPKDNRVFLVDKATNIVSYELLLAVLEYKTAVVRGDMAAANSILPRVPKASHNMLARFLESQGLKDEALQLATDESYRCELAIALDKLHLAASIARENPSELKWSQITDLATSKGDLKLAEECMKESNDYSGLLTLFSSRGDREGMKKLAKDATDAGLLNIAFTCNFMLANISACLDSLISSGRFAEAAIFARSYLPSQVQRTVELWKADLRKSGNIRAADSLADPESHPAMFPDFAASLAAEKARAVTYAARENVP
eukprot:CAMPEP_0184723034 /NCGR_PEP_ID=MMETSP0314-20130426/23906_1 /TAXON_ID=38298 /ORGANISM="Rhodella maculata, Strain CCMP 736" /LENGTH=825 /DNA_ID=CAMNT_0027187745 /DNA_START=84 /DNA_END=2558 /DNA_ORIENTATION=+